MPATLCPETGQPGGKGAGRLARPIGTALAERRGMCARASEGGPIWWELQAARRAVAIAVGLSAASPPLARAEGCPPPRLRELRAAAARTHGLDEQPRWRSRARWSAALPWVTVQLDRGLDWEEGGPPRTQPVAVDHDASAELRLTWRLDRLVYDRDEARLAAAERAARRARVQLDREVTQLYFKWRRASADHPGSLDEEETFAQLDALTGGWLAERAERCR